MIVEAREQPNSLFLFIHLFNNRQSITLKRKMGAFGERL